MKWIVVEEPVYVWMDKKRNAEIYRECKADKFLMISKIIRIL